MSSQSALPDHAAGGKAFYRLVHFITPVLARVCSIAYVRYDNSAKARSDMTSLFQILMLLIDVAFFMVIVYIIMGWLIAFQVLNLGQPIVAQLWTGLNRLLEPVFGPIRRLLPQLGGLDLAPLIVILALYIIEIILRNNAALFV